MKGLENTTSVGTQMGSHMLGAILWNPRVDGSFVMSGNVMSVTKTTKMPTHTPHTLHTHSTHTHTQHIHTHTHTTHTYTQHTNTLIY